MSKHRAWATLVLSLGVSTATVFAAWADEPPVEPTAREIPFLGGFLTESRILYPLQLQGWEARDEHRYEEASLGVSVEYVDPAHKQRWLTLYFYPAGVMSDAQVGEAFNATMQGIEAAAKDRYTRFTPGPSGTFEIALGEKADARRITGQAVEIDVGLDQRDLSSAMALLVTDLYFVKGRLTVEDANTTPAQVRAQLEALMTELVRRSEFRSTGACWMPPPIVANARLDAKAKGVIASHQVDGKLAAVSFQDRVEAVDPDSDSAQLARMLLMATTGRFVEGCEAPESMTPTVPADMRELRFEYPPPRDNTDGTTPRLRSARRGVG